MRIFTVARKIISVPIKWFISVKIIPANIKEELGIDPSKPILYLLQTESFTDQIALGMATKAAMLPDPKVKLTIVDEERNRSYFLNRPQTLFTRKIEKTSIEETFSQMFHLHREHPDLDLQVVPVFISWGRAAGNDKPSGFAQLLADRASPSWLRKLFIVLFLGRDNFVSFSKAVSTQQMSKQHGTDQAIAQKLVRVAATHFHRKRQALTGPSLLERQSLRNSILGSNAVKQAIQEESEQKNTGHDDARSKALSYIEEISADYREGLIRIGDRLLGRIWNKIYNGINVSHSHRIRELAQNGHEIIYVPCHRSHMDYLLLTYVIYHEGLVTPHIAAGINLNFWPVGKIFRRAGAFFLRRSFAGNKLYTAVFREYLELLFNKGYSVKYYPEGGRSRTGRLLPPKTGMLAMTIQAVTKGISRPVSIVPVYLGYEHVMEVKSYQKELKGKSKKKESPLQIFSAIRKLKNYGHGFVNFGEPIQLNQFLDEHVENWYVNDNDSDKKPSWLTPAVNQLADTVMTRINKAAALNGTALVAICLLSSKTQIMSKDELTSALDEFLALFKSVPFSSDFTLPTQETKTLISNTLALNRFEQTQDDFGTMIGPKADNAVMLTYYRNNIIHLFAIPSLIAAIIFAKKKTTKSDLLDTVRRLYPLLQKESFLHYDSQQAEDYTSKLIAQLKNQGLIIQAGKMLTPPEPSSSKFYSIWLMSRMMQETWQRYAVVLSVLEANKSIGRSQLEKQSKVIAERLSSLYGMSSPEFYDKNVLSTFVNALRENRLLDSLDDGTLQFSEGSLDLKKVIQPLVWPEIIQHLESID